jgi:hypothetical protein
MQPSSTGKRDVNQTADASRVKPPHWFAGGLQRHPRLRRELWLLAAGIILAFIVMPVAIYFVGVLTLGPYTAGGLGSFISDYYRGLFHGWLPGWGVVFGPYLLLQALRLLIRMRRWLWPRETAADHDAD